MIKNKEKKDEKAARMLRKNLLKRKQQQIKLEGRKKGKEKENG